MAKELKADEIGTLLRGTIEEMGKLYLQDMYAALSRPAVGGFIIPEAYMLANLEPEADEPVIVEKPKNSFDTEKGVG